MCVLTQHTLLFDSPIVGNLAWFVRSHAKSLKANKSARNEF